MQRSSLRSLSCFALLVGALAVAVLPLAGCKRGDGGGGGADGRATYAFVTNGKYAFWDAAQPGVVQAGRDLDVGVLFRKPENVLSDQKQVVEDLLNRGIDGLAISVIDPENQNQLLGDVASRVPVITHDSDAPESARRCFIGVDNYKAGQMAGELCMRALPDGGEVALFIGNLSQDNARLRRQGFLDTVLGREGRTPLAKMDPSDATPTGNGYTIVGTWTDDADVAKAKANVEDALNAHPEVDAVVGFFQYNPAQALQALKSMELLGKVTVVGFDEHQDTLDGIAAGHVVGTVVQNPYEYGYQAIRILDALHRGDESVVPDGGFLEIPARSITKDNLDGFRAELAEQMAVLDAGK